MIGLLLIGHAPFADTLLACAQHVYGRVPERCTAIDVLPDADVVAELDRAREAVIALDRGDGVLVLVDLFGATPANIAAQLVEPGRVDVVAGVNLPMLLRTLCYRGDRVALATMVEKALGGGASGIMKIASTSPQDQQSFPGGPGAAGRLPHATDDQ
jgi:PTS system ascorbate-specific IIA component